MIRRSLSATLSLQNIPTRSGLMNKKFFLLSSLLLISGSLLSNESIEEDPRYMVPPPTFEEIIPQMDYFLVQENWDKLLNKGNEALAKSPLTNPQKAEIHGRLASAYFYISNFEKVEEHAKACRHLAEGDLSLNCKSLYLLSSYYRTIAQDPANAAEASTLFDTAKALIEEALVCPVNDPFIEAKIFYNAGALASDKANPNLQAASLYYTKAMDIFQSLDKEDEYNRTAIRQAKVLMLKKQYKKSHELIEKVRKTITRGRTYVHLAYIDAMLALKEGNHRKAREKAEEAVPHAKELKMRKDINQLTHLIEITKNKRR